MAVVRTVDAAANDLKEVPTLMGVMLDPCKWGESPGLANPLVPMPCIQKRFDTVFQWLCDDTNPNILASVSTLKGAITWQVNTNRFIRWGFVEPGTTSVQPAAQTVFVNGTLTGSGLQLYQIYGGAYSLTWPATPLPYNGGNLENGVAQLFVGGEWTFIQPTPTMPSQIPTNDMSANFTKLRAVAGFASLSTTTSTIGTDASSSAPGRFCIGNVNSLTDVMQVLNENGDIDTFNSETILQASMPPDEGMNNIAPQEGICSVLGPDVLPTLGPANYDSCDRYDPALEQLVQGSGYFGPNLDLGGNGAPSVTALLTPGTGMCVYAGWVTPWQVQLAEVISDTSSFSMTQYSLTRYQNVFFQGGMDPCGVIDTDLYVQTQQSYSNYEAWMEVNCSCVHVFAVCQPNGTILYNSIVDNPAATNLQQFIPSAPQHTVGQGVYGWEIRPGKYHKGVPFGTPAPNTKLPVEKEVPFPPTQPQSTGTVGTATENSGGMYIGTQIIVTAFSVAIEAVQNYSGLADVKLRMRAHSFNAPGEVGPCRIFQFEGLTNGTVLEFKSTLHVQGTPTGPGLPSIRAGKGTNGYFDEENWDRIIRQFNDPECDILHRNWTLREYVAKGRNIDSSELRSSRYRKIGKEKPVRLASTQDTVETTTTVGKKGIKRTSEMLRGTDEFIAKHAKRLEGETVPGEELVNISQIHVPPPNSTQTSNAPAIPSDHGNPILDRD